MPRRENLLTLAELDKSVAGLPDRDREIFSDKFRFGIDNPGLEWATAIFDHKRHYLFDYVKANTAIYLFEPQLIKAEFEGLAEMFSGLFEKEKEKYECLPNPEMIYMPYESLAGRLNNSKKISENGLAQLNR